MKADGQRIPDERTINLPERAEAGRGAMTRSEVQGRVEIMMVTALYAGLLAIWLVILSIAVIRRRGAGRISLGDGGNADMLRAIRGQANFVEYVPLAVLMMLVLEMGHFSIYVLHALGITLLVARLLHGYALSFTARFQFGRVAGAALTFLVLLIEAVLCIYQSIQAHRLW
jgi:uncharacterized membrane protein YecN with MAPEG domain